MAELLVNLKVPIPTEPVIDTPALIFAHWLPLGDSRAIVIERDNIVLKLWFDITSWSTTSPKEEDLPRYTNVLAGHIFADAVIRDVPQDLLQYMADRDYSRRATPDEEPMQQRYDEIAEQLLILLLETLNRFLSYVRSRKGQYWLVEYPIDLGHLSSYFVRFKARARSENGSWFRFGPTPKGFMRVQLVPEERYVRSDEWDEIRSFMGGSFTDTAGTDPSG